GESIVNATGWSMTEGYETTSLPSLRMIVDLGNLDNSVSMHTTGQSGPAYHQHYIDMAPLWANVEYYSMTWEAQGIVSTAEGHLVLSPK
ncbi:MAG TPA: penicillin acylase family protein, partial [Anaerolineales bacterium]|nr:penicillin acylase family protein [Anaerolineales bacterium]